MLDRTRRLIRPPTFNDSDKNRVANLLNMILWSLVAIALFYFVVAPFLVPRPLWPGLIANVGTLVVYSTILWIMHTGRVRLAASLFSFLFWGMVTVVAVGYGGVQTPAFYSYFAVILVSGLLLGPWGALGITLLSILSSFSIFIADVNGLLPEPFLETTALSIWWIAVVNFSMAAFLLFLSVRGTNQALERVQENKSTLAETIEELEQKSDALAASLKEEEHSQRLLLALSQAGQAVQHTTSPDAVYRLVTNEIDQLGFQTGILTLTDDHDFFYLAHTTFAPEALQIAERLTGLSREKYRIPIDAGEHFRRISIDREAIYTELTVDVISDVISQFLASQLVRIMGVQQRTIGVPITAGERLFGIMFVIGSDLRETDVPAVSVLASQMGMTLANAELLKEVRTREIYFRSLIENALDLVTVINPDSRIRFISNASSRILGYRPDELVGRFQQDLVHPDDVETVLDQLQHSFLQSTEMSTIEARFRHKDGSYRLLELSGSNLISDPVVGGVIVNARDITDRRTAEETATRLGKILDDALNEIYLFDAESLRIVQVNKRATDNLGHSAAVLSTMTLANIETQYTPREFNELLMPLRRGELDNLRISTQFERLNGSRYPVEVYLQRSTMGTRPIFVAIVVDITERLEADEMLRRQDRLSAVGQLAAGIAHDFNNVLAVIRLQTDLLLRTSEAGTKDRKRMETIRQQTMHASALTNQILDFSRQSVMALQPVNLLPFMKEFTNLLERTLPEHIKISFSHGDDDEYIVNADLTRIQQAIMNLAVNSRDAMPSGGELSLQLDELAIDIGTRPLTTPGMTPGRWIRLQISDNGSGIDPEVLPHLFEPFFTTKPRGQGTGLGLAQVYGIVKQHNGFIDVKSRPTAGTTFTLYLPAISLGEPDALESWEESNLIDGYGERILVVEDNSDTRMATAEVLALLNYDVVTAANGAEALLILEKQGHEIDCVLSDVVMPEMGGMELLKQIRERGYTMPIAMLTGHPLGEELDALRDEGLQEWLSKPVSMDDLSTLVTRLLYQE